jgi:pyruvate,orthophosphate dikinase
MVHAKKATNTKYVYYFGGGQADGNESMKNLLGGKGANLAEMAGHPGLKLPVPPGFTITTEVCSLYYFNKKKFPEAIKLQAQKTLATVDKDRGKKVGDENNPLLVSVSSGARKSMQGMM